MIRPLHWFQMFWKWAGRGLAPKPPQGDMPNMLIAAKVTSG